MSICSEPDLFYCRVGDRLIFLDVAADSYFCLTRTAESAFLSAEEQAQSERSQDALHWPHATACLVGRGPIVCAVPHCPTHSVLDEHLPSVGILPLAGSLYDLAASRARLRLLGLRRTLAWIRRRKGRLADNTEIGMPEQLHQTIAAFAAANGIVTSLDNCLSQSVAVAARLLNRSIAVELVIGVRLGPFNAHCWVQQGDRLVNDRIDMVRMFTPILVI